MPTTLPSSFASAAAGGATDASGRSATRADGGAFGDWTRRPNGATQTFRRSSTATGQSNPSSSRDTNPSLSSITTPTTGPSSSAYNNNPRNSLGIDARYSKAQLLELFKDQRDTGDLDNIPAELFVGDVDLHASNGQSSSKWTRRDESYPQGPEVCWEREGGIEPLGLLDMTEEEKELFITTVNSPLKGPSQTAVREGSQRESIGLRKSSMSHGHASGNAFGLTSPTATKPTGRRREPSETFQFSRDALASPSGKADTSSATTATPPASLIRRKTDFRESSGGLFSSESKEGESAESPFSYKMRSVTGPLSAGLNPPSSPWSTTAQADTNSPMGSFGNFAFGGRSAAEKRPGFGAARGDSRFRTFMTKSSLDEEPSELQEKGSVGSFGRFKDPDASFPSSRGLEQSSDRPESGGTDAFNMEDSAPSRPQDYGLQDDHVLSSLGMNTDATAFASFAERQRGDTRFNTQQYAGQTFQDPEEPMSPTFTNPYQSPQQQSSNLREVEHEELDVTAFHLPGLGGFQEEQSVEHRSSPFGNQPILNRAPSYDLRQPDRIQTSGPMASRGLQGLGGLGGLHGLGSPGPWSSNAAPGVASKGAFGDAFGDPSMRSPATMQSPGLGGLGGSGRGRLGPLFQTSMQDQMRPIGQNQLKGEESGDVGEELTGFNGSGFFQNNMAVGTGARGDVDSPFRQGRGKFDDFFNAVDRPSNTDSQSSGQTHSPAQAPSSMLSQSYGQFQQAPLQTTPRTSGVGTPGSSQPPAPQQKQMVMPDRIRWIYRDPQGNTQGPWSGLEMHDWYRAGFFSPELLVKKVEDPDYEPLAQLIRRIGNSREPFLVPQIGIPGPPSSQGAGWPNQPVTAPPTTTTNAALSAQPPFAGSFPSFGTTLTAEQQNALERRKQEEQYLMARQKEHLAQQQVLVKQLQMQNQHAQLQHHSSAHSLQSQPSFSSMNTPNAFQNSPMSGSMNQNLPHGVGTGFGPLGASTDMGKEDPARSFERLNLRGAQGSYGIPGFPSRQFMDSRSSEQRSLAAEEDRAKLQAEQEEYDRLQLDSFDRDDTSRLEQFHALRDLNEDGGDESVIHLEEEQAQAEQDFSIEPAAFPTDEDVESEDDSQSGPNLSLTEQVQKAASATQSPWSKVDPPMAERPPQSASPLPAPAARRSRQNVADALAAESTSASPSVESAAASVAPWARDPASADAHKQPSLKEIQEAEARRAAKQEEMAAAARRAALEKELANQPQPPAPGLPSSSTWGSAESPVTPAGASGSAWAKPLPGKPATTQIAGARKTIQQIQKEQEALARKQKAAVGGAAAVTTPSAAPAASSGGKRYADLAGKGPSTTPPAIGGSWTTVGASGKTKVPPIQTATTTKPIGSATNPTPTTTRPKPSTNPSSTALASAQVAAQEEFKKWVVGELRSELTQGIKVEEFVQGLLNCPSDTEVITEAVHGASQTIDSRHFAEEFVRRRALAEKGKTESAGSAAATAGTPTNDVKGGGWSEVARKGPVATTPKEEANAFKVVAKKKGGKR